MLWKAKFTTHQAAIPGRSCTKHLQAPATASPAKVVKKYFAIAMPDLAAGALLCSSPNHSFKQEIIGDILYLHVDVHVSVSIV